MSSKSFKQITQDINQALVTFRKDASATMAGFGAMAQAALAPGVLSELQKELIALAIGVASRCDGCIGFHVKALVRLGVTREQLTETLAVAVYMGGGPALMSAAEAWRAYEEFSG
jgi:AhpD family alkylhydroperoxidase